MTCRVKQFHDGRARWHPDQAEVIRMVIEDEEGYLPEFVVTALDNKLTVESVTEHRRGECDCDGPLGVSDVQDDEADDGVPEGPGGEDG